MFRGVVVSSRDVPMCHIYTCWRKAETTIYFPIMYSHHIADHVMTLFVGICGCAITCVNHSHLSKAVTIPQPPPSTSRAATGAHYRTPYTVTTTVTTVTIGSHYTKGEYRHPGYRGNVRGELPQSRDFQSLQNIRIQSCRLCGLQSPSFPGALLKLTFSTFCSIASSYQTKYDWT